MIVVWPIACQKLGHLSGEQLSSHGLPFVLGDPSAEGRKFDVVLGGDGFEMRRRQLFCQQARATCDLSMRLLVAIVIPTSPSKLSMNYPVPFLIWAWVCKQL